MKRLLVLLLSIAFLSACQDEDRKDLMTQPEAEKIPDSIQVLKGEIIFGTQSAVIRGEDFVYGVTIDSISEILSGKVDSLKKDDFDMVPVTVKAKIIPNPARDGWEEIIEIREIIEVSKTENVSDTIEE
ncbi:hypothetical protein [Gramella sp. KN1008]|uniref:hypothetical protein n=1 Tax=Gramella sp. KN1008 TaxID=2529298 RepID=UPI0010398C9F|nr:hypothetical protein [Gramella sp. KN1008]TBW27876.1 hypothetical protein EZJ28_09055 [Gramella sp. KN1008]